MEKEQISEQQFKQGKQKTGLIRSKKAALLTEGLLLVLWMAAYGGSRLYFLFSGSVSVSDPYGYFEKAMVREPGAQGFSGGLSGAYEGLLRELFRFMGNKIETAAAFQAVLLFGAALLLFFGCRKLFGKIAAFAAVAAAPVLSDLFFSVWLLSPVHLVVFNAAFAFLLIACAIKGLQKKRQRAYGENQGKGQTKEAEAAPREQGREEALKEETALEGAENGSGDEKKARFIENPLPLPKKYVKRKMEFQLDQEGNRIEQADDFDLEIQPGDDFDY